MVEQREDFLMLFILHCSKELCICASLGGKTLVVKSHFGVMASCKRQELPWDCPQLMEGRVVSAISVPRCGMDITCGMQWGPVFVSLRQ